MEDQRKVDKEEGKKLAEELGFHYMETSVKYGINVNKLLKIQRKKLIKLMEKRNKNILKNNQKKRNGLKEKIVTKVF